MRPRDEWKIIDAISDINALYDALGNIKVQNAMALEPTDRRRTLEIVVKCDGFESFHNHIDYLQKNRIKYWRLWVPKNRQAYWWQWQIWTNHWKRQARICKQEYAWYEEIKLARMGHIKISKRRKDSKMASIMATKTAEAKFDGILNDFDLGK